MVRIIFLIMVFLCNFWIRSYAENTIADAIELYQKNDFKGCITKSNEVVKSDPTSILGYYYLGLSYSKLNNKDEALKYYNKVINLGSDKTLTKLAKSAKAQIVAQEKNKQVTGVGTMLEDPDEAKKAELSGENKPTDQPVQKQEVAKQESKPLFQKQETQKNNDKQPTNDEIVNAIRVLQKAGLLQGGLGSVAQPQQQAQPQQAQQAQQRYQQYPQQNYMPPEMDERTREMQAMMMMMNSNNNGYGTNNGMMNMLPYMQNGGKMSPQMIQMMMMKNMMPDFSSGSDHNNGY